MLQDEYYVIESENNDNSPLFAWDQYLPELDYLDENEPDGFIFGIDKLVLDESVLKNIELKNRLIFELEEKNIRLIVD